MVSTMVNVSWDKIEMVMRNNGIKYFGQFAGTLGHGSSWLSNVKNAGRMKKSDAMLFKSIYGCDIIIPEDSKDARSVKESKDNDKAINVKLDEEILGIAIGDSLGAVLKEVIASMKIDDALLGKIGKTVEQAIEVGVYRAISKSKEANNNPPKFEKRKL